MPEEPAPSVPVEPSSVPVEQASEFRPILTPVRIDDEESRQEGLPRIQNEREAIDLREAQLRNMLLPIFRNMINSGEILGATVVLSIAPTSSIDLYYVPNPKEAGITEVEKKKRRAHRAIAVIAMGQLLVKARQEIRRFIDQSIGSLTEHQLNE